MTPLFTLFRRASFSPFALCFGLAGALAGCEAATPQVSARDPVIPQQSPSREVQALSSPSTTNTEGGSGNDAQAYCLDGVQSEQTFNPDGTFVTEWDCGPGGGIDKIRNEGSQDENGDGAYDQITILEDGTQNVWHFTVDSSEDFTIQAYTGVSEDGSESYEGVYTYLDASFTSYDLSETWSLSEGTYVIDGVGGADGSFVGTTSFNDVAGDQTWVVDQVNNADGTFSQDVVFSGEGFSSQYTYAVGLDGSADYSFTSDLLETAAEPDWVGAYVYAADGSGEGSYTQLFDDASTLLVSDVMAVDGSLDESWVFNDAATDQDVDQEGSMHWNLDGSAEGSVTTHIVGGDSQTCDIHVSAAGDQTVDNCT